MPNSLSSFGIRFAPSPTGAFHIGNLRTAWVAQQWAQALQQPLVIRFENIDKPRNIPGAQEDQIEDMKSLKIKGDVIQIQSDQHHRHWGLFQTACEKNLIYPCFCSRSEVQDQIRGMASAPHTKVPLYSGHCRNLSLNEIEKSKLQKKDLGWRFKAPDLSGQQDFLVARAPLSKPKEDFSPAYNWACAIDDHDSQFAILVRAWDLDQVIEQQRLIHDLVDKIEKTNISYPKIFHTSLVIQDNGHRLEKRTPGTNLKELLQIWTPEKILRAFDESFDQSLLKLNLDQKDTALIFGETLREITLSSILS